MAGGVNNFANLPLKTDSNGYLLVTIGGGNWTPTLISIPQGSAAAPTLVILGDIQSGIYQRTVGTFNIGIGGNNTFEIAAAVVSIGNGAALSLQAKISKYNNINTAGQGVPSIYGEAISAVLTTGATILTVAPATTTAGRYRVQGNLTTTSGTNTGTVQLTVDYKDSQGTVHTADIMPVINAAGAIAVTGTAASKEFHAIPWEISVDNTTTNIVVKAVTTGVTAFTAQASVEQIG